MPACHPTLLIPALRPHADGGELPERLPALEILLSRADRADTPARGREASLFALFDAPFDDARDLPVATVSYAADTGSPPAGPCLRADPVHLLPDRDQLVLLDAASLDLREAEAEALLAELNVVYAEEGWRFEAPCVDRWYLHLAEQPRLKTWPLSAVNGRPIGQCLPGGEQGKAWHVVMNEIQMLLHGSGVNRQREAEGRLVVSGLWLWGGGEAPVLPGPRWARVWSGDPVASGLALLAGAAHEPLPADAPAWLSRAGGGGEQLLVLDALDAALRQGGEAWWAALQAFERQWIEPLLTALRDKRIDSLSLDDAEGRCYRLTRRGLRRWWRRRQPLSRYR